jgi:hypothetical protein
MMMAAADKIKSIKCDAAEEMFVSREDMLNSL